MINANLAFEGVIYLKVLNHEHILYDTGWREGTTVKYFPRVFCHCGKS